MYGIGALLVSWKRQESCFAQIIFSTFLTALASVSKDGLFKGEEGGRELDFGNFLMKERNVSAEYPDLNQHPHDPENAIRSNRRQRPV